MVLELAILLGSDELGNKLWVSKSLVISLLSVVTFFNTTAIQHVALW
jgi:hypothetical protein